LTLKICALRIRFGDSSYLSEREGELSIGAKIAKYSIAKELQRTSCPQEGLRNATTREKSRWWGLLCCRNLGWVTRDRFAFRRWDLAPTGIRATRVASCVRLPRRAVELWPVKSYFSHRATPKSRRMDCGNAFLSATESGNPGPAVILPSAVVCGKRRSGDPGKPSSTETRKSNSGEAAWSPLQEHPVSTTRNCNFDHYQER
jgi:hypothetical protein